MSKTVNRFLFSGVRLKHCYSRVCKGFHDEFFGSFSKETIDDSDRNG